uniref:Odorant binding protein 6 n=1 Tax=Chrysopa pallens TaxID=417485 RepID=A0A0R8P0J4_CHRPA|nr:odorant binding protein 6 [Chrysopa pallens]ANJ05009.1 odorant-binding protein [Chrysopa pallens]
MVLSFKTSCILNVVYLLFYIQLINCETVSNTNASVVSSSEVGNRITLLQAVETCNSTYKIDEAWLREFNNSGTFPDEFKTEPKCFVNCVLKECGMENEDQKFDIESSDFYLSSLRYERLPDMVDVIKRCIKHTDDEESGTDKCERSYVFAKCVVEELSRRLRSGIIAEL